jgi:DNA-binding transcriptional LysR family regulator
MNNLQIEYFLSLAEHKNFTNTAKALYVSQPAISKQIAALEKKIGFSLFFRSNHNVSLTPAGMVFFKTFTEIKDLYKKALTQTQDIYNDRSKKLRLGCVDGMEISNLLNKLFESFQKSFPNVEYQLERNSPNDLIKALYNDHLDIIITLESFVETDQNLNCSSFLNKKHMLYVSANHPALSKESFDISDFKDETFIVLSPGSVPTAKDSFFLWCKENGFTPNKVKYVPNVESQMLSAEVGLGVTIADSLFRLNSNPLLRSIELNTSHNIVMVWKKNNTNLLIPSFARLASQINNTTLQDINK